MLNVCKFLLLCTLSTELILCGSADNWEFTIFKIVRNTTLGAWISIALDNICRNSYLYKFLSTKFCRAAGLDYDCNKQHYDAWCNRYLHLSWQVLNPCVCFIRVFSYRFCKRVFFLLWPSEIFVFQPRPGPDPWGSDKRNSTVVTSILVTWNVRDVHHTTWALL